MFKGLVSIDDIGKSSLGTCPPATLPQLSSQLPARRKRHLSPNFFLTVCFTILSRVCSNIPIEPLFTMCFKTTTTRDGPTQDEGGGANSPQRLCYPSSPPLVHIPPVSQRLESLGLISNSIRIFFFICIKNWELLLQFHLEEMTIWGEDSDSAIVARHLDRLCKAR